MGIQDIPIMGEDIQEETTANAAQTEENNCTVCRFNDGELTEIKETVTYLKDLFVRRLNDDKQKTALIQKLCEAASYSFIEPFLYDIILLLDRIEKQDDAFAHSVYEELLSIIERRGVMKIEPSETFDPAKNKVVRVNEVPDMEGTKVSAVLRNGYMFSGKVVRPAEVVLDKGVASPEAEQ